MEKSTAAAQSSSVFVRSPWTEIAQTKTPTEKSILRGPFSFLDAFLKRPLDTFRNHIKWTPPLSSPRSSSGGRSEGKPLGLKWRIHCLRVKRWLNVSKNPTWESNPKQTAVRAQWNPETTDHTISVIIITNTHFSFHKFTKKMDILKNVSRRNSDKVCIPVVRHHGNPVAASHVGSVGDPASEPARVSRISGYLVWTGEGERGASVWRDWTESLNVAHRGDFEDAQAVAPERDVTSCTDSDVAEWRLLGNEKDSDRWLPLRRRNTHNRRMKQKH